MVRRRLPPDVDTPPAALVERLRAHVAATAPGVHVELDDIGGVLVFVRRDMLHLDADALNDRLAAWTARELRERLPHAEAFVSFRVARPATMDDAELDLQEKWLGLEPTFRLELERPRPTRDDGERFARLVPEFLRLVEGDGRPADWRAVDGNAE